MTDILIVGAIIAGVVGLVTTRVAEVVGRRRSLLDIPNDRSSHVVPTPRLGGLGLMAGAVAGWAVLGGWADTEGSLVLAIAVAVGLVGLLDDFGRMNLAGKYLAQLVAAAAVVLVLAPELRLSIGDGAVVIGGIPAALLTTVGLTAVVNAFNFMDGIDGIVGSITVVLGTVALGLLVPDAALVVVPVVAATVGFLAWNTAPASIFMGDSGSQFLGLVVGASLLRMPDGVVEVVPAGLLLAALLFDTGFTLVRRALARRDLFAGHREHLYQRVVQAGRTHREVAVGYAAATGVLSIGALAWSGASFMVGVGIVAVTAASAIAYVALVGRLERAAATASAATPTDG